MHIKEGDTSATFDITTSPVKQNTAVTITANLNGIKRTTTKTATLSINPVQPKTIAVSPSTVKGGVQSLATITINGMAPPGGADISLKSSNAHAKVQPSIHIGPGSSSVTAAVNTTAVTANTTVTITATSSGASKSATLAIHP